MGGHDQIWSKRAPPIEGFHRVTFMSNFDVNVEIGGLFGDQEHIMAIEAAV